MRRRKVPLSAAERQANELRGAIEEAAKWKRKCARRGVKYMELLDQNERLKHEIRKLEKVLVGLYDLDEPTDIIVGERIKKAIHHRLERAGRDLSKHDPPCDGPGYSHPPHGHCPGYSTDRT